jgi:maleylpyruvate isomerase
MIEPSRDADVHILTMDGAWAGRQAAVNLAESIAGCAAAHERLARAIGPLSDADVRAPSLLPGWSAGHVLSHLARNADSVVRRLVGAMEGEVVDQYPGGRPARAAEIEAGVGRPVAVLVDDVVSASRAVDDAFATFPDELWNREARNSDGVVHPVSTMPFGRWREVEVHLVDLGIGITPESWPPALAEAWLPDLLPGLADRTDQTALLAWVLRRGDAPDLEAW